MTKKGAKRFTMQVQLTLNECPEGRYWYTANKCKGKILKIEKVKDKWIVDMEFKASSMIELMVACDDRFISTEIQ